jgi:uncharacterized membrane-anchored protein
MKQTLGEDLEATNASARQHPGHPRYWTAILATSTAGTTMSDFMNRSAGLDYTKGALVAADALSCVLLA